ncbi:IclR family transcriptional regulator [Mesorhizobium sp. CGMCC 1.15528]|jgi:DNA-binding IclR family transcriptional regulator|uniref:IclR family transcriptional regulator n=1 Tax=Mesorhizobium zhangyense TaxID=1776730 RepID=A0A7C9RBH2_9HYPH|nr:IclR family transcriptional regulator [Mesorhizobium zhangyense]NGN44735.1 IclR family transcriptional regulator [Mesorhizobium zhangyense]
MSRSDVEDEADAGVPTHVQGAASFSKFITVLQIIADAPGTLDIAQLTKRAPFPRGTVYRLVAALMAEGLVTQSGEGGTFRLGPRLLQLAAKTWEDSDLRTIARDFLVSLRDATDEAVHLAVPSNNRMVYIDKLVGSNRVQMKTSIGGQVELHSTSVGKAWLSGLPDQRLLEVIKSLDLRRHTAKTFTTPETLFDELKRTREQGFAFDDEENEPDIRCLGSPIFNRSGEPVGAVSISMPVYRHDARRHELCARLVRQTARLISTELSRMV